MIKKLLRFFLAGLLLVAPPFIVPLRADSLLHDDNSHDIFCKIVFSTASSSADLGTGSMYHAQMHTLDIMNQNSALLSVGNSILAPDQTMIFTPFFTKEKPEELRILVLYRSQPELNIWIINTDEQSFNDFTQKRYKTRFHHVLINKRQD